MKITDLAKPVEGIETELNGQLIEPIAALGFDKGVFKSILGGECVGTLVWRINPYEITIDFDSKQDFDAQIKELSEWLNIAQDNRPRPVRTRR